MNQMGKNVYTPAALRATLQFVLASDIPSEHKAILIEALTETMRDGDAARRREADDAQRARLWQEQDAVELQALLQGRIANSWQHADELLMRACAQLHRSPDSVREKAIELGLGVAVDYRLARLPATEDRLSHQ